MEQYFKYFIAFAFIWCICGFGLTWFWLRKKGIKFPDKSTVNIKFEEKTASGHSHKTAITKIGGGRNCINVVITDQELWIKPFFPFNLVGAYYDAIHKIPLSNIQNVTQSNSSILVDFKRPNGEEGRFELLLENPGKFITTVQETT